MRNRGFTLIELMIVVAIIAIIAAVAIPGLLRSRIGSNEASAQGSLKSICTGQEQFKSGTCIDLNANGVGEYGFLEELGGVNQVRADSGAGPTFSASPYIPRILGDTTNSVSSKAGYHFMMWLPNPAANNGVNAWSNSNALVDNATAEAAYICYGWPQSAGRSGVRAFVIDIQGQPYSMANTTPTFSGTGSVPAFDAALTTGGTWNDYIDDGGPGQAGGQNWVPTG